MNEAFKLILVFIAGGLFTAFAVSVGFRIAAKKWGERW